MLQADYGSISSPAGYETAMREFAIGVPPNPALQYVLCCVVVFLYSCKNRKARFVNNTFLFINFHSIFYYNDNVEDI